MYPNDVMFSQVNFQPLQN